MLPSSANRFTTDEYHRLVETGDLREDDRVELLRGRIIPMPAITPMSAAGVNRLLRLFGQSPDDRWITSARNPIAIDSENEPVPDFALLHWRDDFYSHSHPTPGDVFLVVEVSDSAHLPDREEKFSIYANSGISEIWILDCARHAVEIHRDPAHGRYAIPQLATPGQKISPSAHCDFLIDPASLLPPQH